jgi:cellulose synthase/poly-beta-1,6-N-acetylglucosamine synthase-like glycosyltransferase
MPACGPGFTNSIFFGGNPLISCVFALSIFLIIYTFWGYPLILFILSLIVRKPVERRDIEPVVTIIIPVHNEERIIGEKIRNCLNFDYPKDKLKIVVVSDGSTDGTEDIVKGFGRQSVDFVAVTYREGKVAAQNYAVRLYDADIFIFTDVAISTNPDCIRLIVQNFADKTVGAVSCRDVIIGESKESKGERSYIQYDMLVRKYTAQIGSIIGVTGGFYATRREIAKGGWNPAFPPDFYVAIRTIKRGLRVIEDARVKAFYKTASKEWDELQRKVRTINRGMTALFAFSNRSLMNPLRYGMAAVSLITQKLFRWMMPFFLMAIFVSNVMLLGSSWIAVLFFIPQLVLYLITAVSFFSDGHNRSSLFKLAFFFGLANIAILKAWYELAIGKRYTMWQPTRR